MDCSGKITMMLVYAVVEKNRDGNEKVIKLFGNPHDAFIAAEKTTINMLFNSGVSRTVEVMKVQ